MTNPTSPSFYLTGLTPDTGYMIAIVASNTKGYSARRALQAFTIKSDGLTQLIETNESALATNMDDMLPINPFLIVTLIVVGVFMSVFLPISIIVCVRKRKRNSSRCQSNNQSSTNASNIANTPRDIPNVRTTSSDKNQSNLKLLNSADDIFSEFEDTGSSFSGGGIDTSKNGRRTDTTTGPDLIPPYSSISDHGNFLHGNIIFFFNKTLSKVSLMI